MKITIVGTGYVGLVTGTCFAETGNDVTCIDIDESKIKRMQEGKVPIYEPGLEELFKRNIHDGRLTFTTNLSEGVAEAEVIFLALPTPPNEDGTADLSYILGVAKDLGGILDHYAVIVDKSTVPVGTAEKVRAALSGQKAKDFDVVSNPEFLREGLAVTDFLNPDRVVLGTSSDKARVIMKKLYSPLMQDGKALFFMDERSAEMTKYAANAFLATKISFMNEIANLCETVGADVDAVRLGIGSDPRIGNRFLFPGIGYGGSCFPKDVLALHRTARENEYQFKILEAVTDVNAAQKQVLTKKIMNYYDKDIKGKTFALWGLAFKPDTDDIREAPALGIITSLLEAGAKVQAYDPEAMDNVRRYFKDKDGLSFTKTEYDALEGASALLIATDWPEFKNPDFERMKQQLLEPVIFDGRNLYDLNTLKENGFYYESIGRSIVNA